MKFYVKLTDPVFTNPNYGNMQEQELVLGPFDGPPHFKNSVLCDAEDHPITWHFFSWIVPPSLRPDNADKETDKYAFQHFEFVIEQSHEEMAKALRLAGHTATVHRYDAIPKDAGPFQVHSHDDVQCDGDTGESIMFESFQAALSRAIKCSGKAEVEYFVVPPCPDNGEYETGSYCAAAWGLEIMYIGWPFDKLWHMLREKSNGN